jgi:hypothetical protein
VNSIAMPRANFGALAESRAKPPGVGAPRLGAQQILRLERPTFARSTPLGGSITVGAADVRQLPASPDSAGTCDAMASARAPN